jgi:hypothetical protein
MNLSNTTTKKLKGRKRILIKIKYLKNLRYDIRDKFATIGEEQTVNTPTATIKSFKATTMDGIKCILLKNEFDVI